MKHCLWNMFSAIKNAQKAKKSFFLYPQQKNSASILNILWQEGFILGYKISKKNSKMFKIFLKYKKNEPIINKLYSLTKPRQRVYYSSKQLWKINFNTGLCILSTNKGIMSIKECIKKKIGGELLVIIK